MSAFREAVPGLAIDPTVLSTLEPQLVCPKCEARNRTGVLIVHVEDRGAACCSQCAHSGPVQDFQPRSNER